MEKCKVLIIENDEVARESLVKSVRKDGFEALVAENGQNGIDIFKKENPDIVITDLRMPDVNGLEIIRMVKSLSSNVQVILITAHGDADIAISALREGAMDYLKIPVDTNQLAISLGRAREKCFETKMTSFSPTLLLAEDDNTARMSLSRVLENEDWKVLCAADGQEAVTLFQQNKIDVALLDIKMPKKDGVQALREMRELSGDFEAIIITGYGNESSAVEAMRNGAMNFLRKPIDLDQMIVAVEKAMEKLKSQRALKFRTREIELANDVIAKITTEKEIIVDFFGHKGHELTGEFTKKLIDAIPLAIVVIDREMNVRFMNRQLASVFTELPERIDDRFIEKLDKIGVKITYKSFEENICQILESGKGTLQEISIGKHSYLTLTSVTILGDDKKENLIFAAFRGERGR
ncbi:MAG: response regulator [Candidatus Riflebacteria bacterium]|nr:response regulator [Candidatus Riflebacteria bacterium]